MKRKLVDCLRCGLKRDFKKDGLCFACVKVLESRRAMAIAGRFHEIKDSGNK